MDYRIKRGMFFRNLVSAPFILIVFFPMILFDLILELYHRVCFPLYGLKYVHRSKYFKFDRLKLSYLNPVEKLGCVYCSYATGFLAYSAQIVEETEKYWCGIKHKKSSKFIQPKHHKGFVEYGDEKSFKKRYG